MPCEPCELGAILQERSPNMFPAKSPPTHHVAEAADASDDELCAQPEQLKARLDPQSQCPRVQPASAGAQQPKGAPTPGKGAVQRSLFPGTPAAKESISAVLAASEQKVGLIHLPPPARALRPCCPPARSSHDLQPALANRLQVCADFAARWGLDSSIFKSQ